MHWPSPHVGAQNPHPEQAFAQHVPLATQSASQPQPPPLGVPHSQVEHACGSSGQSAEQEQLSSACRTSQVPFPQHGPQSSGQLAQVSAPLQVPSPHTIGHDPQSEQALSQQVPSAAQPGRHEHPAPPPPHSQAEQAVGSSGQSAAQLQEFSPRFASHTSSPQHSPQS